MSGSTAGTAAPDPTALEELGVARTVCEAAE